MQGRAQGGVADQYGGLGLVHHQREVRRAAVVVGRDAVALGEQQLGEPDRRTAGGAQGDPLAVEPVQRQLADDHARHDRAVAADGDVGESDQLVGVAQILHEGDRADVQVAVDQLGAELLRGVLGQLQVEQGTGSGETPVEGDAVQELDVADPGAGEAGVAVTHRGVHIADATPGAGRRRAGVSRRAARPGIGACRTPRVLDRSQSGLRAHLWECAIGSGKPLDKPRAPPAQGPSGRALTTRKNGS